MRYEDIVESIKKFFKPDTNFNKNKSSKELDPFSYWDRLLEFATVYPDEKSLYIEYRHLEKYSPELAEELLINSDEWLSAASDAISDINLPLNELPDVKVRIFGLPTEYEIPISKLRNNHLEKFLSIRCVISKATAVRPAYEVAAFKCLRCGHITLVPQSKDTDDLIEPFTCENDSCGKKGPFKRMDEESTKFDHQYLKIQEPLENLRGRQPEFLYVSCADEIAGIRKPGEKVIISGILKSRVKVKKEGKTKFLEFLFVANSVVMSDKDYENIEITPKDIERIKELSRRGDIKTILIKSIAPSIFGHENVKEGLALQLFSGIGKDLSDGTRKRGDIHVLMVGDPGVAKSQFLKFIANFAPRAMQVSGRSASAAGLTGAAVRDDFDGKWAIEAGALTMAGEGGVCCVDEVDKMSEKDRASIHDALEQQYVHVAKAGVFAKLPTACAFLGAANPKYGRYDKYESISDQFKLGDALLSRMDLLFVMHDTPDAKTDEKLAWYILDEEYDNACVIDQELLRKYIAYAKTNCSPVLTDESKQFIVKYFVTTRSRGNEKTIPITVRSLEAARRLAVANAKMRLSDTVDKEDAIKAIEILNKNLKSVGIDPETGYLDAAQALSGVSTSQLEKIRKLKDIIRNSCKRDLSKNLASIEDILRECETDGIDNPEYLISRMKEKGDLSEPIKNKFQLVR